MNRRTRHFTETQMQTQVGGRSGKIERNFAKTMEDCAIRSRTSIGVTWHDGPVTAYTVSEKSRKGLPVLITFRFRYPISRTMAFEREYHPNLRLTLSEKRHLLKNAIAIWMLDGGKLVGETYGLPLDDRFGEIPAGCPRDPRSIYCYSTTILGNHQRKGFGRILKAAFIGRVARNFHRIYGHARPGASQALNQSFGAHLGPTRKNWHDTGEDFRLYVLRLH